MMTGLLKLQVEVLNTISLFLFWQFFFFFHVSSWEAKESNRENNIILKIRYQKSEVINNARN